VVHFRLAELESEVEALRSLAYRTVGKYWIDIVYHVYHRVYHDNRYEKSLGYYCY
jgi:alkylation response protein AidB-like acyl-CoA dehydrogenase